MKVIYSTLFFLFINSTVISQTPAIIGIDCDGGLYGKGQLFSIDGNYSSITTLKEFEYVEGNMQYDFDDLCLANNGKYYGTQTYSDRDREVIFEYNVNTNSYKIVYEFDKMKYGTIVGGLVKGPNGFLYGVTQYGVTNPYGTLYRFSPQNYTTTLVHSFDSVNQIPNTKPIIAKNNKIYGTTQGRVTGLSPMRYGTLYEYDIQNNSFTKLFTFNSWYRGNNSRLVEGTDSCIYGVREGSMPYYGRVYRYNYSSSTYTKIYEFDQNTYYQRDFSDLLFHNDHLYISAYRYSNNLSNPSYSAIHKLSVSQSPVSVVASYNFVDSVHGRLPLGEMYLNSNKEIVGTMFQGGPDKLGAIFTLDTNLSNVSIKSPFSKTKRVFNPSGRLIHRNDSILIGISVNEPFKSNYSAYVSKYQHGLGSIYEYNFNTDSIKSKIQFGKSDLGHVPTSDLLEAGNGLFYMVNKRGGKYFSGTILEYNISNNSINKIHDIDSVELDQVISMQLLNSNTLIGLGVKDTSNKIFEYDLVNDSFKVVHTLAFPAQGFSPVEYHFTLASNGKLYGVTMEGQRFTTGKLFEYNPITNSSSILKSLYAVNVDELSSEFVELNQKLYCTYRNINSTGVFEYDIITDSISLYPFQNTNFYHLDYYSPLSSHSNGKLYGLVNKYSETFVFEFDFDSLQSNPFAIKKKIENYNTQSGGKFIEAPNKKFYFNTLTKSTYYSYPKDTSKLVEYDVVSDTYKIISSTLTKSNCGRLNNFIILNNLTTAIPEIKNESFNIYPNPVKNQIYISGVEQIDAVDIFNNTGQSILRQAKSSKEIDVSYLQPGIYYLRIHTKENISVHKIIKL